MAGEKGSTSTLQHETYAHWETWTGTAEDLIAAGIVERILLPGEPGNNKVSATYYRGQLVRKASHNPRDEHYLSITRYGRYKYIVRKGRSFAKSCRQAALERVNATRATSRRYPIFQVGEEVFINRRNTKVFCTVVDIVWRDDWTVDGVDDGPGYSYHVFPDPDASTDTKVLPWEEEALEKLFQTGSKSFDQLMAECNSLLFN